MGQGKLDPKRDDPNLLTRNQRVRPLKCRVTPPRAIKFRMVVLHTVGFGFYVPSLSNV